MSKTTEVRVYRDEIDRLQALNMRMQMFVNGLLFLKGATTGFDMQAEIETEVKRLLKEELVRK